MDNVLIGVLAVWIALALVLAWLSARLKRTTVFEYERGLKFTRGRYKGVLDPGMYRHFAGRTQIQKVDMRPTQAVVTGQEVLSADGVALKASVIGTFEVKDPERALLRSGNYLVAIHTELQLALRAIVSSFAIDDLLAKRTELSTRLKDLAGFRLGAIGIELSDAALRDLTFPGELKKIYTQVVKARQEGLAALEKARGETAALRSLANAASLVERNPSLMQLRTLQVLAQQPNSTLVVGMPAGAAPIPVRDRSASERPPLPAVPDEHES